MRIRGVGWRRFGWFLLLSVGWSCHTTFLCGDAGGSIGIEPDVPARGSPTAPILIEEFTDFQCPYCAKAQSTLIELDQRYPGQLRFLFRHNPLPFHEQALGAAKAAVAAGRQGRFWDYEHKLFVNAVGLSTEELQQYAIELGLDLQRFHADMQDPRTESLIQRDKQRAQTMGCRGTPNFLVNGRVLRGAQPVESFAAIIDEELAKARTLAADGVPAERIAATLFARNRAGQSPEAEKPPPMPKAALDPDKTYDLPIPALAPTLGRSAAPVTITIFADLQCPFTARALLRLLELQDGYAEQVRLVFRHFPLDFHRNAETAARAAMAAERQGKFWPFVQTLIAQQADLQRPQLTAYAQQLGLEPDRFATDMDDPVIGDLIRNDLRMGQDLGVRGTPTLFFNGRPFVGLREINDMRKAVEAVLQQTEHIPMP